MAANKQPNFLRQFFGEAFSPEIKNLFYVVVTLLIIGTAFYSQVEQWSWVDSLYFSITTLTTVGYGDLSPTTDTSKLFTTLYILVGLGVMLTFLQSLARRQAKRPFLDRFIHHDKDE